MISLPSFFLDLPVGQSQWGEEGRVNKHTLRPISGRPSHPGHRRALYLSGISNPPARYPMKYCYDRRTFAFVPVLHPHKVPPAPQPRTARPIWQKSNPLSTYPYLNLLRTYKKDPHTYTQTHNIARQLSQRMENKDVEF